MKLIRHLFAAALLLPLSICLPARAQTAGQMRADVARLVDAARKRTLWPWQPAEPEVARVARYGPAAAPLLLPLLPDDPETPGAPRYYVQQQVALALCRIYHVEAGPGRVYMNRVPDDINARIRPFWLQWVAQHEPQSATSAARPSGRQ